MPRDKASSNPSLRAKSSAMKLIVQPIPLTNPLIPRAQIPLNPSARVIKRLIHLYSAYSNLKGGLTHLTQ